MSSKLLLYLLATASAVAATTLEPSQNENPLEKRGGYYLDGIKIYERKRNAHACMMSIVFIVLFPLGAISLHLPLKGVRVVSRIHAPIQLLGLAMMIGAFGLGIDIADNDLDYFGKGQSTKAHVVIGFIAVLSLIIFQPALGVVQHLHFKRTGKKSILSYIHRWLGRIAIILGWINSGLGFQLVPISLVATHSLVRNFTIMGILGALWFLLVSFDAYRHHLVKKDKIGAYRMVWGGGFAFHAQRDAEVGQDVKLEPTNSPGQERVAARDP